MVISNFSDEHMLLSYTLSLSGPFSAHSYRMCEIPYLSSGEEKIGGDTKNE
jgi:hypothetical protein